MKRASFIRIHSDFRIEPSRFLQEAIHAIDEGREMPAKEIDYVSRRFD